MHGVASGPWRHQPRRTVESCDRIDIRTWHRQRLLTPGREFSWPLGLGNAEALVVTVEETYLVLRYCHQKCGDVRESIPVEWTPCHFGGHRPWFRCPGVLTGQPCNQRVAVLCKVSLHFLCRRCQGLAYWSQQVDEVSRLQSKVRKLSRRVGGTGELAAPIPPKPKRMQWRTYDRLVGQALTTKGALLSAKVKALRKKRRGARAVRLERLLSSR